jgi:hypothetical protein
MEIKKTKLTVAEKLALERLQVENQKLKSQLDYLSMMVDVDIDIEEGEDGNEQEL